MKAEANGSKVFVGGGVGDTISISSPKPVIAASKADSKILPPTAFPFPLSAIGLRKVSAIRMSDE